MVAVDSNLAHRRVWNHNDGLHLTLVTQENKGTVLCKSHLSFIYEAVADSMLSTCYFIWKQNQKLHFCIYNSIGFDRMLNLTGLNAAPNHVLQMAVDSHCCTSLVCGDKDLNQMFQIWIHHSVRPIAPVQFGITQPFLPVSLP